MKTRIELWKEYRESIERNISLQKAVMQSNEKLNILHKRLLEVFPEYDVKYKTKLSKFEASINKIEQSPSIDTEGIQKIINAINDLEKDDSSFASIESINFESDELKEALREVKSGKVNNIKYVETDTEDISIGKTKKIKLGEKMPEYRIAIDGPSGSGKSTIAKMIAKEYDLKYINTGLVYRAIALYLEQNFIDANDEDLVVEELKNIDIKLLKNEVTELNGVEVTTELRSDAVSQAASIVASYSKVREFAVNIQKREGSRLGVIMDGRDTTFKIMPDADLKIFLDTTPEVRARRRVEQNEKLGYSTDYDEILNEIKIRDQRDRTRETDPLHKTEDAHLIDASDLSIDQVIDKIKELLKEI